MSTDLRDDGEQNAIHKFQCSHIVYRAVFGIHG